MRRRFKIKIPSNKVVSFDFDGTLEDNFDGVLNNQKDEIQGICKDLVSNGNEVFIITKRLGPDYQADEHQKVYQLAIDLGINPNHVYFTNRELKHNMVNKLKIDIHFENNIQEAILIQSFTNNIVVCISDPYWRDLVY